MLGIRFGTNFYLELNGDFVVCVLETSTLKVNLVLEEKLRFHVSIGDEKGETKLILCFAGPTDPIFSKSGIIIIFSRISSSFDLSTFSEFTVVCVFTQGGVPVSGFKTGAAKAFLPKPSPSPF